MPDLMENIGGIFGRKVRPITKPSCVMSIVTVPPVLDHLKQCPVPFSTTELFGGERRIHCLPVGMKWRRRGWNDWCQNALIGQAEVYPCFVIVEGSDTGSKYIAALEIVPEVINGAIVLVVLVVLVLIIRFCVAATPPPP